ncbi:MAG: DUF3480 domain-containing protein [Cyanobacteriota/Melainabacteria group bacterium]
MSEETKLNDGNDVNDVNDVNEMDTPNPPVRFEIFPNELFATVNLHEVRQGEESFSCWSFVSEGLSRLGQRELAMLIRKQDDQSDNDYPTDVLGFFLTVRRYAMEQNVFMEGDITEFGESGFLDPKFKAIAYVRPLGLYGAENTDNLLNCILLSEEELEVARRFGLSRVVSLLGHKFNHYPCPPWVDLSRASTVNEKLSEDMNESILAKVPFMSIPHVRVCLCVDTLKIFCRKGTHEFIREFLKQIPKEAPLSIGCDIDPAANAMLVWQATMDNGPSAITPPGSDGTRVAGCSVLVFPEQDSTNVQVIEDSFFLSLKTEDWEKLRNALMTGKPSSISAHPGGKIEVEWYEESPEVASLPVPEAMDHVPDLPTIEHADGCGKVLEAELKTEEEAVLASINPRILCQYIEAIEMTVLGYFIDRRAESAKTITLDAVIEPDERVSWKLVSEPEQDDIELKGIQIRLGDLPVPALMSSPVEFAIKFQINASQA